MNALEVATLFNLVGVTVILLVSLLVGSRYPNPFFRVWARAYAGGWLLLLMEYAATHWGRPGPYVLGEVALVVTVVWYFLQAGRTLGGEQMPRRWLFGALGLSLLAGGLMQLEGLPYAAVMGPFVLGYAAAHIWVGWWLIQVRRATGDRGAAFLGGPLIASGLWFFTYPVTEGTEFAWAGYLVSTALNLAVGTGLIVYLVEDTVRQLKHKNEELTRLDALKNTFISTISHELRTPITSIHTAGWLLREGSPTPLNDFQAEMATTIWTQSKLLGTLVDEVMDYARLESGTMHLELQALNLGALVERHTQAMAPQLQEKGLTLTLELPPAKVTAWADPTRIAQVVQNLLANAVKFTPSGGEVFVRVWGEGGAGKFSIRDTGIGIADEYRERIFERFFQVDPSSTRSAGGLGLGLSLCAAIIDGHKGEIQLRSDLGAGSTFVVCLPASPPEPAAGLFTASADRP